MTLKIYLKLRVVFADVHFVDAQWLSNAKVTGKFRLIELNRGEQGV